MKDLSHHMTKFMRKMTKTSQVEEEIPSHLEKEYQKEPSSTQKRKQKKLSMKKERKEHIPSIENPEERNREQKKQNFTSYRKFGMFTKK